MKKGLCLLLLIIGACSWRSPNSEFYMMNSQAFEPLSQKKISAVVAKVQVPDILDRAQMVVYEEKDNQIKIMEFVRWGEAFPEVLQSTVVNDLMTYLPNSYVKRTYFDSQSMSYSVNIEINSLRAYRAKEVILSAWWNVTDTNGKIIIRRQGVYTAKVNGPSISDLVDAQTQAVHLMSKDIAEHLIKL